MEYTIFYHFNAFQYIILPSLICLARICDVTLGTIRIMYVAKGMKNLAMILGFFEVLIWLFAIGQIMQNLNHWINYLAYASGYAIGNFIGITIEEKLSVGTLMLKIFSKKNAEPLIGFLRSEGYGATRLKGDGIHGPVDIVCTIIKRKNFDHLAAILNKHHPSAMYTVEDIKFVSSTPFPLLPEKSRWIPEPYRLFPKRMLASKRMI